MAGKAILGRMPRRWTGPQTALVLGVAAGALLLAFAAKTWCGVDADGHDLYVRWCYSDVPPLWFAERLDTGAIPYLDHAVEYPVLIGAAMWLAALPASDAATFFLWTGVILAACAFGTAWLLDRELGSAPALAFAAAPTLAISAAVNWDLLAVLLATAGIVAHRRARDLTAGVMIGLGAAAKLYPAILLPVLVLAAGRLRGRHGAVRTAGAAVGAWAIVNLPVAIAAPDAWGRFFALSRDRPSDWDALTTVVSHVTGWAPSVATLNLVTGVAFLVGAAALVTYAVRHDPPERWHLVALPLVAWFLLTSKVYSPQFSLWLLPLLAFAFPSWSLWGAFALTDVAVTLTRFPYLANFVGDGVPGAAPWWPFAVAVVTRAVVLGAVAMIGWRRAVRRHDPAPRVGLADTVPAPA